MPRSDDRHPGLLVERLGAYARLARLDRPIGTLLLLWPTLWALWIAGSGSPDPYIVLVFVIGTLLMRSAGCVVNDIADRRMDPHVKRTRSRPLATGEVSVVEALWVFACLSLAALALVLTLNRYTLLLSLVALALAASYPFAKRVTQWPQVVLGVAFSWGIPMAFAAHQSTVPAVAWWLLAANLMWVTAYDTIYAMVDRDDDIRIGVKSTAVLFGSHDLIAVAVLHGFSLVILCGIGWSLDRNEFYYGGLLVAALFGIYQLWCIRTRERDACLAAFFNNSWFGAAVFGGIVLSYL